MLRCLGGLGSRRQRVLEVVGLPTRQVKIFVAAGHVGQFGFRHAVFKLLALQWRSTAVVKAACSSGVGDGRCSEQRLLDGGGDGG